MLRNLTGRLLPVLFLALLHATTNQAQTLPPDFSDALVLGGFVEPVGNTWDGNGRSYVWEKSGRVWIIENGIRLPDPLVDIREEVGNWRDHGLLGFALDPNFLTNGNIYLMYVVDRHHLMNFGTGAYDPTANTYFQATIVRITRYTAVGPSFNSVSAASRFVLLGETPDTGVPVLHESHSAGTLAFGTDGTLMASVGDGATYFSADMGNATDTYHDQALVDGIIRPAENVGALRAQMVNSLSGKILRLDPVTGNGVHGNPWYDMAEPRAPRSRVWALGVRNPYRFTIRPGSGSTAHMDADPGTLYIGDVGWNLWEELNVCTEKGMNFGWPLFEGMDQVTAYMSVPVANLDAPSNLFNGVDCTQQYYTFQDLIRQATPVHLNAHPDPCDPSVQIPVNVPKHFHARPSIDWRHGNQSRTGGFLGNVAISYDLDEPNSPVPGPRFGGFAAIGGPWSEGLQMPLGYQGATFHGDYAMGFIRRFMFDGNDHPVSVHNFASGLGAITWIGAGPDGCIWYIRYNTNELRRICYDLLVDLPPVAVAEQNVQFGPTPLVVSFTGSNSSDPGGGPITFHWDFGDGEESTDADPTHTYTAPAGVPTTFNVVLTVTDEAGQSSTANLIVSVNNTPPVVEIISFEDGAFYPVGVDTIFTYEAVVTDAEHGPGELFYEWRTVLHHNTHTHPEPVDTSPETFALISGVGCDGETYSYNISLTVTDAGGLSTTVQKWLYPACHLIPPTAVIQATPVVGFAPLEVQLDGTGSFDPGEIVSYEWDLGDGTFSSEPTLVHVFTTEGPNYVTLTVTDDDGLTDQAVRVINVITLDPPQCVGSIGGILREVWTGIPGSTLGSFVSHPAYQGPPTSTSILGSSQAPSNSGLNYGARLRGYIVPAVTGDYVLTLTSDDASAAFLSLNADPVNKQLIANVPGFTLPEEYDKYPSQVSSVIELQAGVYYYVEVLHKQGTASDHLALRWQLNGSATPTVIPGAQLAPYEDCPPGLNVRVLLQGTWDNGQGMMRDDLRVAGHIPLIEPYTAAGYTVTEPGTLASADHLAITGQNAIVDWVLVELRDPVDPSMIVAGRAAFLQRDGDLIGLDGHHRLLFDVPAGEYHVAVRHRNHLGAMNATAIQVSSAGTMVDFTTGDLATHGSEAQVQLPLNRRALWSGNVINDDVLRYTGVGNDREPILQDIGGLIPTNIVSGYYQSDVNMDGLVKYMGARNDRDLILINVGGNIPTAIRQEQLP